MVTRTANHGLHKYGRAQPHKKFLFFNPLGEFCFKCAI